MTGNKLTLTYVEAFLLSTQSMTAFTLHQQYNVVVDQINQITCLSDDLRKLSSELIALKTANVSATQSTSAKISGGVSPFDMFSYLDPKIILCAAGTGVIYYYVIPAITGALSLFSLKSLLIPLKSAVIGVLPFMKEVTTYEFIKDDSVYRVKLMGGQVIGLDARRVDEVDFSPVSDLISKSGSVSQAPVPIEQPLLLTAGPAPLDTASSSSATEVLLNDTTAVTVGEIINQTSAVLGSL